MFASAFLAAVLASAALVRADPTPSDPSPGDVFNQGANCHIDWDVDTTGVWSVMNIELMCGDNYNMVYLTTVGQVNGADPNNVAFDYPCPAVDPPAPIYFYQFTSPYSNTTHWTGRFAIADANGTTVPAANNTQPDGENIPWGIGKLVNAAQSVPMPSASQSIGSPQVTAVKTTIIPSASGVLAAASSTPASSGMSTVVSTPASSSSSSPTAAGASGSTNGAGSLEVNSHVFRAALALGVAAITFAVAL